MAMALRTKRALAYAAIYFLWGGSFLAIRVMVAVTPPFVAAGMRFLLAGLLLYGFARWRGAARPTRREQWHSFGMGVVMFGGNYACLFWAEQRLASGTAAVFSAMIPIWILLGETLLLRTQRLSVAAGGGVLLGILGVGLVSRSVGLHRGMLGAAAVLLLGTLLFSFATLWSRALSLPGDQLVRAGLQMSYGGGALLLLSGAAGEFVRLPEVLAAWHWQTLAAFVYLVTFASILAFTAYTWLIHHEAATRVASYAFVNPLIALVLGVTLGGEHVSAAQAAGAMLVILGVVATLLAKGHALGPPPPAGSVALH